MRNQKAKIFEDLVVPMEATKKQNDFYKLARIKSSVSLPRQPADAVLQSENACGNCSPKNVP